MFKLQRINLLLPLLLQLLFLQPQILLQFRHLRHRRHRRQLRRTRHRRQLRLQVLTSAMLPTSNALCFLTPPGGTAQMMEKFAS